uniref:Uncharacterized protein n=1 Tax=viral metagenome TaxID=1070528 RepID=A0A6C0CCA1_9ZZZZ
MDNESRKDLCTNMSNDMINILSYDFNLEFFLTKIYNFKTFDDVIIFSLDNEYIYNPLTIKRIHNCAWRYFGTNKDNITTSVLNYYYNLAIKLWMNDYMDLISKKYAFNLSVDSDVLQIDRLTDKDRGDQNDKKIQEIINVNLLSYDFFTSVINMYLDKYAGMMEDIKTHYKKIKNFMYQQLIKSIENKIN